MLISSGLNSQQIRVGIVLPEDQIQTLQIDVPQGFIDPDERLSPDNSSAVSIKIQAGGLWVSTTTASFQCNELTLECDAAVESLSTGAGFHIQPVVAGRGFHWEKQIAVDLPGQITITTEAGALKLINTLDVEAYVACVATSEMGAEAPADLLAAQTIVARCWSMALAEAKHLSAGFDVCNDDCCQRYQGTSFLTPHSLKAAIETKGEILVFENAVIDARYSKNCGGMVEDYTTAWAGGPVPYLIPLWDGPEQRPGRAVEDFEALYAYDDAYCSSKRFESVNLAGMLGKVDVSGSYYRWEKQITKSDLLHNLEKYHGLKWTSILNIRVMDRGASARIKYLYIDGLDEQGHPAQQLVRSEYGIRKMFSDSFLYSSAFVVKNAGTLERDPHVILRGVGWGHGVGLCQMGALGMALDGIAYQDILKHYYPGTTLTHF